MSRAIRIRKRYLQDDSSSSVESGDHEIFSIAEFRRTSPASFPTSWLPFGAICDILCRRVRGAPTKTFLEAEMKPTEHARKHLEHVLSEYPHLKQSLHEHLVAFSGVPYVRDISIPHGCQLGRDSDSFYRHPFQTQTIRVASYDPHFESTKVLTCPKCMKRGYPNVHVKKVAADHPMSLSNTSVRFVHDVLGRIYFFSRNWECACVRQGLTDSTGRTVSTAFKNPHRPSSVHSGLLSQMDRVPLRTRLLHRRFVFRKRPAITMDLICWSSMCTSRAVPSLVSFGRMRRYVPHPQHQQSDGPDGHQSIFFFHGSLLRLSQRVSLPPLCHF